MHSHSGCHNNDDDDDDDDCDGGVGDGNNDNDANSNFYYYRRGSKDHRDRVAIQAPEELRYKCYRYVLIIIGHLRVSKTLTFKMRPSAQPFWLKWVLFAWEWKIISIFKAEHWTSFWNRGPGELGNGLLLPELISPKQKYPLKLLLPFCCRHKKDVLLFNSVCNMTSINMPSVKRKSDICSLTRSFCQTGKKRAENYVKKKALGCKSEGTPVVRSFRYTRQILVSPLLWLVYFNSPCQHNSKVHYLDY